MHAVGTTWLREHFEIVPTNISHESFIGSRRQRVEAKDGRVEEIFSRNYWPGEEPLDHVEFSLKYDHLSLDLLSQVFRDVAPEVVAAYVRKAPTSKYRRKIGFLYELLTPRTVDVRVRGNFVPVLDPKRYFTGKSRPNARWRVSDNLLGLGGFFPIVRRTKIIEQKLKVDWSAEIRRITARAGSALLARAVNYLYLKETKASFEIEREEVSRAKEERFVRVLAQVGTASMENVLDEQRLTELQNLIVDPRYAEKAFRTCQNYVGETLPGLRERVHYVCPPPILVKTLMAGLRSFLKRSGGLPAPLRAAVISFGFVYVHPFEDGNGRLHRLLLHESLAYDDYTERGVVLPFSAVMLRDMASYDRTLESFSKTVMRRAQYTLDESGRLTVTNPNESSDVWRYPDLTTHVEYVLDLIETTVTRDLPEEIGVLQRLDVAKEAIARVVDMPGRKLNLLLHLLYHNRGKLSANKRKSEFSELTTNEVQRIESAFAGAFEI